MSDLFIEVMIWKYFDGATAVRYCCFHDLADGKYAVQSADFFRIPLTEIQFRNFEKQFVELFTEISPRERCVWFDSLEEAIKAHEHDFSS